LFEREHHRRIAVVLAALDAERLVACRCLFGGGTAIALRHGEYRESVDIDFIVSDRAGYRELRQALDGPDGLGAIVRPGFALEQSREVRADQYGIRTRVRVGDAEIKLEIVLEGRIELEDPGPADRIAGIATLTRLDMAATKLLANVDRWADDAVHSRDLIDLAMMRPTRPLLRQAIAKAEHAYGAGVEDRLHKAVARLRDNPHRLGECMRAMRITTVSQAQLWQAIRRLG
jgi:hypothetical protein